MAAVMLQTTHLFFCVFCVFLLPLGCLTDHSVRTSMKKDVNNVRNVLHDSGMLKHVKKSRVIVRKQEVGQRNLAYFHKASTTGIDTGFKIHSNGEYTYKTENSEYYKPGDLAKPFTLYTLKGKLNYPSNILNETTPILIHAYNPGSGFLQCMWNCSGSVEDLIKHSPGDVHYIFMSHGENAYMDATWMHGRFATVLKLMIEDGRMSQMAGDDLMSRLHFVTLPVSSVGNWIPLVLQEWACVDHNCGLDQLVVQTTGSSVPHIFPRLDARYDWLPSPGMTFQNKTFQLVEVDDGCNDTSLAKGHIVAVTARGCSYFEKVSAMERSGAVGVVVIQDPLSSLQDMNCQSAECNTPLSIPATMVHPIHEGFFEGGNGRGQARYLVSFQTTPCDNFFMALDQGRLAEVGWLLYPSFRFLAWQAQWFNFQSSLRHRLAEDAKVITIFNQTIMQGKGADTLVTMPALSELQKYTKIELDLSMSCLGSRDTSCPHWDHTVQLFVCCNQSSPLCGQELGRWISPFRRRIGRWLTDVTPLVPLLLTGPSCRFTLKTVPWAMAWKPSLNIRLTQKRKLLMNQLDISPHKSKLKQNSNKNNHKITLNEEQWPVEAQILYQPGFTFDQKYNSHFQPHYFTVPDDVDRVSVVAVITGHGSDENGCGEFCITSHHFAVNGIYFNRTFDTAGTPLGCAEKVTQGVLPNEHGTWLYGRDGWCDGQQVEPWVFDISSQVKKSQKNKITYFGWFNGTDPDPKQNPGVMTIYSFLVFYKDL